MPMTAVEKILARTCGLPLVKPGDTVYPDPDLVFVDDGYVTYCKTQLDNHRIPKVFDPKRIVFITDHAVLYTTPAAVAKGADIRRIAREWGIERFFDVGQGGNAHVFPMEMGMVSPGHMVFANDSHCSNNGAIGALGMRAGTEIACVVATGTLWIEVPQSIRMTLKGKLQPGVYGRDFGYRLARDFSNGTYGADWDYRAIEFAGPALDHLSLAQRVAMCNSITEIGSATLFFPPNEEILAYARERAERPFEPVYSDADATYEVELTVDLDKLQPQVVMPGSPDQAVDIAGTVGKRVDHAYVGSCGSGMYEDLQVTAEVLKGRKIASGTRFFVVPGSVISERRMLKDGLTQIFQDAGAIILPAGCGPCTKGNMAPLAPGETSICTAATNFNGRMGAKDAEIYLASPATVACSAVAGKITDPREFGIGGA